MKATRMKKRVFDILSKALAEPKQGWVKAHRAGLSWVALLPLDCTAGCTKLGRGSGSTAPSCTVSRHCNSLTCVVSVPFCPCRGKPTARLVLVKTSQLFVTHFPSFPVLPPAGTSRCTCTSCAARQRSLAKVAMLPRWAGCVGRQAGQARRRAQFVSLSRGSPGCSPLGCLGRACPASSAAAILAMRCCRGSWGRAASQSPLLFVLQFVRCICSLPLFTAFVHSSR